MDRQRQVRGKKDPTLSCLQRKFKYKVKNKLKTEGQKYVNMLMAIRGNLEWLSYLSIKVDFSVKNISRDKINFIMA